VHDIVSLETAGVPGVFVMSTEFVDAADAQATALGLTPASVIVPHPIQNRTDDELHAMADAVVAQLEQSLIAGARPSNNS
jgi:hypothetical protein